ncbi:MAG: 3-isopropylmalate dehydratase small subunit [Pseudomonadota bacterium]
MQAFTHHIGVAAPLLRDNIDTDQIIPSREMKTVSKAGLGGGLFAGWRYQSPDTRMPDPDFVLNRPDYSGASILLSGANFGCGSSREHAVWALMDFGFCAIIAESFGEIFFNNCIMNGLLPISLLRPKIEALGAFVSEDPQSHRLDIDLDAQTIVCAGDTIGFDIATGPKSRLLKGLDAIGETLQHRDAIAKFLANDARKRPWAYAVSQLAKNES